MWTVLALLAAVLWGLEYVINEQVYKQISVMTSLGLSSLFSALIMLAVAYLNGHMKSDLDSITNSKGLLVMVAVEAVVLILAEFLIALSITEKSATLASLIEISYPFFIALFAFLLFKEQRLGLGVGLGGLFILIGITIIYYFGQSA